MDNLAIMLPNSVFETMSLYSILPIGKFEYPALGTKQFCTIGLQWTFVQITVSYSEYSTQHITNSIPKHSPQTIHTQNSASTHYALNAKTQPANNSRSKLCVNALRTQYRNTARYNARSKLCFNALRTQYRNTARYNSRSKVCFNTLGF